MPNSIDQQIATAPARSCGMDIHMDKLMKNVAFQAKFREKLSRAGVSGGPRAVCSSPVKVPVAIHFVGLSSPNASCLETLSIGQINALNKDFQGTNTDITLWSGSAAAYFPGVSNGEACLQFEIASRNHPSGTGLSDGDLAITINQVTGDFSSKWANYLNIFVIKNTGYLGYSPLGGDGDGDGVVIDAAAFGVGGSCGEVYSTSPYNKGRTLTHELGHYFFLDHIWGRLTSSCTDSDNVSDTPNQDHAYFGCQSLGTSSCGSVDMHMSYMDYTNDACMYMFSAGQVTRMENYISSSLSRITNNAANVLGTGGGTTPTCSDGVQNQGETGIDCGGPCTACATCNDGIKNQGETGIDCGGPCKACATCNDGIKNQGETGIDCGGPCKVCVSCNDGLQNGEETGVDCGGPDCEACPTCEDEIQNGEETGVDCGGPDCEACPTCEDEIQNGEETGVDCGGPDCEACPTCEDEIQNGEETGVDCGGPDCEVCPTCEDEIQNGEETGVDCGGPDCAACPTCEDEIQNGAETGVDCGGPDCEACPPPCYTPQNLYADEIESGRVKLHWSPSPSEELVSYRVQVRLTSQQDWYDFKTQDTFLVIRGTSEGTNYEWRAGTNCERLDSEWSSSCFFTGNDPKSSECNPPLPTCEDGKQNGEETGVDCGGPDCAACPTCEDEIQNGDETGIDCGGSNCAPCPEPDPCEDGFQNGDEEGIDCGGSCENACPSCDDDIQNQGEEGVDCGGPCLPCNSCPTPDGLRVDEYVAGKATFRWNAVEEALSYGIEIRLGGTENWYSFRTSETFISIRGLSNGTDYEWRVSTECSEEDSYWSAICTFNNTDTDSWQCGVVETPTCEDEIQNGDETGVDCGGSCVPCEEPETPTCEDEIQNGDETGVDCGGSCVPCEEPETPTCEDEIQNGDETGVDCGGSCVPCEEPETPTCEDEIQNGDETGIDCGGSCEPCSNCTTPTGLYANNFGRSSVTLNWEEVSDATTYSLQIRLAGNETWSTYRVFRNSQSIRGIASDTDYEWRVSANCGSEESNWSAICSFNSSDPNSGQCEEAPETPTCEDGIQNGDETGIDCGGSCAPCEVAPTCDDGIQNGDETGIDCGGTCTPCEEAPETPTCEDGIQNGDETGIDCGGSCAPCETPGCPTPTDLDHRALGGSAAIFTWTAVPEAQSYVLQARIQGAEEWTSYNTRLNRYFLSRLSSGSPYEVRLQSDCGEESSAWTTVATFVAGTSGLNSGRLANRVNKEFSVFPNPATTSLTVEIPELDLLGKAQLSLIDLTGKVLLEQAVNSGDASIRLDVSSLPRGLYFVRLEGIGAVKLKRVVIQ